MNGPWKFWIDVGGTFTDCIGVDPNGNSHITKVLSSAVHVIGPVQKRAAGSLVVLPQSAAPTDEPALPDEFWRGCRIQLRRTAGSAAPAGNISPSAGRTERHSHTTVAESDQDQVWSSVVKQFDSAARSFQLQDDLPDDIDLTRVSLISPELAPLLAMRLITGVPFGNLLPPVEMRLGTTRGTNALLERKGARTALVTTSGFADLLLIGNQARGDLFTLEVTKPDCIFSEVVEVHERVDSHGEVLRPLDREHAQWQLQRLHQAGIESLAICLMHAYVNDDHEQQLAEIAHSVGFREISRSAIVAPQIGMVTRGDTTVLDAYLNPVLRSYLGRVRQEMSGSSKNATTGSVEPVDDTRAHDVSAGPDSEHVIHIMTSSGGLVLPTEFTGKDSLLSGPAGGAVGFSYVAQRNGFQRAIGFDMGGTSTDVSRFDGTFDQRFETETAGVRVAAPMLAIETVAAGGGSICYFDGVSLNVGPESAGACPGPACYGQGGPLTVTDMNVLLGRVPAGFFPFPLDVDVVRRKLSIVRDEVAASPMGSEFTLEQLAQGFLDIANSNMSRAIRRISISRGHDPGDHVLVTFGGAGAQHACAIARELGITQVLIHPLAGILSALGMGVASIQRHASQSILHRYDQSLPWGGLRPQCESLADKVQSQLANENVAATDLLEPVYSLDLRYEGLSSTIAIALPDDADFAREYEEEHERRFGYRHAGRDIEIVNARVVISARPPSDRELPKWNEHSKGQTGSCNGRSANEAAANHPQKVPVWFANTLYTVPLWPRRELTTGMAIPGPALVVDDTSTCVIEPRFSARVLEQGELQLSWAGDPAPKSPARASAAAPRSVSASTLNSKTAPKTNSVPEPIPNSAPEPMTTEAGLLDPIRREVFSNRIASIAEQMGVVLRQTALSTNVKDRLDFSCGIFDSDGNLIVNAPHIPVHLGAMGETVKAVIRSVSDVTPGDVFVTNDPFSGGSHLPDVTVMTPIHDLSESRIRFWTASRAHHAEIGGSTPGSMPPFSRCLAEEGVLIPLMHLIRGNISNESEVRKLLESGRCPTRNIEHNLADLAAQVAANKSGQTQLLAIVAESGWEYFDAGMRSLRQSAASKVCRVLKQIGDGCYRFTDHLDDGTPISVAIEIRDGNAKFDFEGTGPVSPGNLNANRGIVTAAVMYVLRCLIDEKLPLNSGMLEPVSIRIPQGLLNPPVQADPEQAAAVVGGNVETSQRVVDVLLGALNVAAASQGTMNNLTFGNDSFGYYETICGGIGATCDTDGADAVHSHMTNTRLTDPEILERLHPIRLRRFEIRQESGGHGERRGGNGVVRTIEFLEPVAVSMLSQRRGKYHPYGVNGGDPGLTGENIFTPAGSTMSELLSGSFQKQTQPGDVLTIKTPGGGGFGRTTT